MTKLYVIESSGGEWDDAWHQTHDTVYTDKARVIRIVNRLQRWEDEAYERRCKKHGKFVAGDPDQYMFKELKLRGEIND